MPDQDPQAPSYQDVATDGGGDASALQAALNSPTAQPQLAPQVQPQAPQGAVPGTVPDQPPQAMPDLPSSAPNLPRFQRTVGSTLKGMLLGLALDGLPGAVAGGVSPTGAQATANNIKTFANAQAASAVADAGIKDQQLHALPQQIQDDHNKSAADTVKSYASVFGQPDYVIPNNGPDAMNAMNNIRAQQDGVPHMLIVNTGGQLVAWNMDKAAAADNTLDLLHTAGKTGIPFLKSMTQAQWDGIPAKERGVYVEQMNNVLGTVIPSHDPRAQQAQIQTLNQQIATVTALSKTDPDRQKLLDHLNQNLGYVQAAVKEGNKSQVDQSAVKSAADETAKQNVQRTYAQGDYANLVKQDTTGWQPPKGVFLNEQQINSASQKFAGSKEFTTAQDTERSYQMAKNAFNEYNAAGGSLPSGAQSMLMLSSHLQTTFGNVKGSRVTKDMIAEHLHARSISDDMLVATQKLTNGDRLSANQWNAFMGLIGQSRNLAWNNAITTAHAMRLPVTPDIVPSDFPYGGSSPKQAAAIPGLVIH